LVRFLIHPFFATACICSSEEALLDRRQQFPLRRSLSCIVPGDGPRWSEKPSNTVIPFWRWTFRFRLNRPVEGPPSLFIPLLDLIGKAVVRFLENLF
jgi:hypothetical protein